MFHKFLYMLFGIIGFFTLASVVNAEGQQIKEQILNERMGYYQKYALSSVPWYYLAAVDKYERNIQQVRNDLTKREGPIALQFSDAFWVGDLNPIKNDTRTSTISFFGGNGLDGNGDGKADRDNNDDLMLTLSNYLSKFGHSENNFHKALKSYYGRDEAVRQIITIARIYQHFERLDLDQHAFPLPVGNNYSYRSTWGTSRGWGGRRMHEGTDLFASYGVPVQSTTYGVIEVMGWNDFGGWRIGIRDIHNTYHYFAHLAYFNKGVKEGDIVEPGMIIGFVGSSGYGKKGTSGKFPPHLHYGMYKFNGRIEWAYDPFPSLKHWEIEDRKAM